jgi:hypothetical protein
LAGGIGSYFYQSVAMNHDEEILITHLQEWNHYILFYCHMLCNTNYW